MIISVDMNKVIDTKQCKSLMILMQFLFFLHFQIAPLDLDDHAQTSKTEALIRDNSLEELQVFQKATENRYCTQMWPKL